MEKPEPWGNPQELNGSKVPGRSITLLRENQSVYIKLGMEHRLEIPGLIPLVVIDIQTDSNLGEDDIVGLEVTFNRA